MTRRLALLAVVALLPILAAPAAAQDAQTPHPAGPAPNPFGRKYPVRTYQTMRLQGKAPSIDGRLDDEAWKQGEWSGNYVQLTPVEGALASQPTELKILYDDKNVYMAVRAYDDPAKVQRYPGRRDDFNGYAVDIVGVTFDSYNDKRTGFEFDLTAGGAKIDLVLGNGDGNWDTTWDAVWDGAVAHDEKGWTAEFRIPFNQLRYGPQDEQVWGLHAWRWIARNQEEDDWQQLPRQSSGVMYQLGELHGIRSLPPSRHVEVLPHVLASGRSGPSVSAGTASHSGATGLDAKVGLSSNFTLDATVNPDFGQVEADPSVMNLTAYETFYQEKRPFFLEGRKILAFGFDGDDQLFHSRRIGAAPSAPPTLDEGETAAIPENTTILGAFKVTGKTDGGLSVAALQAFTQRETVEIHAPSSDRQAVVEPFGSYSVARVHKDWNKGNTSLGGMITSSHRWISDPSLAFLPTQATTGGVDFSRYFANRTWQLESSAAVSRVSGDAEAIRDLQTNAVHYYQRPDASHLGVDAGRTSLSGWAGSVKFGRTESGRLRMTDRVHWYSPGFELNDLGYLRQADLIANQAVLGWVVSKPSRAFLNTSLQLTRDDQQDFGGLQTLGVTALTAMAQLKNKWQVSAGADYRNTVDTRALRGGPALRLSDSYTVTAGIGSDYARRTIVTLSGAYQRATEGGGSGWQTRTAIRLRPWNRLALWTVLSYAHTTDDLQYVDTIQAGGGTRWLLGRIDQHLWDLTFRANLTLSPTFTLQYYGSPFIATGRFGDFKKAEQTLARAYDQRFHRFGVSEMARDADGNYLVTESGTGASYSFTNPDFNFRQFRSNLVARWEYKPGSTLYLVWSQGRTQSDQEAGRALGDSWRDLWRSRPDNVLLLKASYWFSM